MPDRNQPSRATSPVAQVPNARGRDGSQTTAPTRHGPCRRRAGDDRGSATVFGLFLIVVVLVLAGVMIEGGNAMSARGHATNIAQQAARAGADKLDLAALRQNGEVRIDPTAARAAATAFLAQVGETGDVTATSTEVSVTVTVTRPGILVPLLGIETLTVRATATAAPITG